MNTCVWKEWSIAKVLRPEAGVDSSFGVKTYLGVNHISASASYGNIFVPARQSTGLSLWRSIFLMSEPPSLMALPPSLATLTIRMFWTHSQHTILQLQSLHVWFLAQVLTSCVIFGKSFTHSDFQSYHVKTDIIIHLPHRFVVSIK